VIAAAPTRSKARQLVLDDIGMTTGLAVLLGVVQGLTEFLPISSKTHLVVVPALLGQDSPSLPFIVLLHLGTLVALVLYFAKDLVGIARDAVGGGEGRRTLVHLAVASVPAAVLGLLFEETFERLLERPAQVAFSLFATAVILVAAEWLAGTIAIGRRLARPLGAEVGLRHAVGIGLAQAVALLPGVSRSGSTMGIGLAMGLRRDVAARFSFLLAIPAIAGANVLELGEVLQDGIGTVELAGFSAALVSGYACVSLLLRYLRRFSYLPFAAYCAVFALVAGLILSR
jgi:undecaprenyl-diphosphatase